ncbi:hypothetical protein [Candidatus Protochlamydia amoebophila]|uniref:Uncharacterized protein n=1 Tax=Candidatus Protochlamydia amoebophila TaxID=362787 RepID=A0A0C1JV97_9BACT|nr:hypothetical protein [Candidatus Protochlamydia amoebophila]KIC74341.1 hypothetical protein DB44_AL00350 [Candidatus Protochlamydia amoebophila]
MNVESVEFNISYHSLFSQNSHISIVSNQTKNLSDLSLQIAETFYCHLLRIEAEKLNKAKAMQMAIEQNEKDFIKEEIFSCYNQMNKIGGKEF